MAPIGPLSLQHESHTKQDQDFKIMDYLSSCKQHKTIGNELQCNWDRTHMAYNEEFILVTNCLHCHIVSIMSVENSHIEKETIPSGTLTILGDS